MRRKAPWAFAVVLAIVTLLSIAACGGGDDASEPAEPGAEAATQPASDTGEAAEAAEPIVIGAAIARSGPTEPFDLTPALAAEIAVEDINAAGGVNGRPLEIIYTDTKSDLEVAPTAALEAIEQGADILVVSCDFDYGTPGATVGAQHGLLVFSLCAGDPHFGPAGISPLAFTAGWAANIEAAAAAEFAYTEQGWETAYILKDEDLSYFDEYNTSFIRRYTELAGDSAIVGEDTFLAGDASFASQVTNLRSVADQVDVIVACTFPPGGATLLREIRAAGITQPIISCVSMGGDYWLEAVPDLSDFYTTEAGTSYPDVPDSNEAVNQLLEDYIAKTGSPPPNSYYIFGYNLIEIIAEALRRAGSTDGEALKEALESFENVDTIMGPVSFTETLHIRANPVPVAIMAVQNGEWEFVTRITPARVPEVEL